MQSTGSRKLSILLVMALLVVTAARAGAVTLAAGEKAPGFTLKDIDGNQVTLEQFHGKTVVIAFWSTWCSRCEEELVFLKKMLGDRTDVAVLLVNQDSERKASLDRVRSIRERLGIRFPVLLDEGLSLWEVYGINALPTSVVIGKDGALKLIEPNFYWGSPEHLLAAIGPN